MHLDDGITECIDLVVSAQISQRLQCQIHVGCGFFAICSRIKCELFEAFKSFLVVALVEQLLIFFRGFISATNLPFIPTWQGKYYQCQKESYACQGNKFFVHD